jgi:hypothetical protein
MNALVWISLLGCAFAFGQAHPTVEVTKGSVDEDGVSTGPASVCLVSKASRECYTPPKHDPPYGLRAEASMVPLREGFDALLFKADAWAGGSGILRTMSLLVGRGGSLANLLPDIALTNQSEYRLLKETAISDTALFVTADYVWGDGESHFGRHRYRVTVYSFSKESQCYTVRDEYVTLKRYAGLDQRGSISVIEPERHEILTRLQHQEQ